MVDHDDDVHLDLLAAFEGVNDLPLAVGGAVGDLVTAALKQEKARLLLQINRNNTVLRGQVLTVRSKAHLSAIFWYSTASMAYNNQDLQRTCVPIVGFSTQRSNIQKRDTSQVL